MREFARFFLTGIVATIGNLSAVWLARAVMTFQMALLVGIGIGFALSFILSKLFAFRSRSWSRARGELSRFLIVYGAGISLYWSISMTLGTEVLPLLLPSRIAEILGAFVGAGTMTLTSYFGHRYFTYRRTD